MIISRRKYEATIDELKSQIEAQEGEIEKLREAKESLMKRLSVIDNVEEKIEFLKEKYREDNKKHEEFVEELKAKESTLESEYRKAMCTFDELKRTIDLYDAKVDLIEYGVYDPIFDYSTTEDFKKKIADVRDRQKYLITNKMAANCSVEWSVDGSKAKGTSQTNKNIKLVLRAFNGECDAIIGKVRWNNVERCREKIQDIYDRLNKLESSNCITISDEYLQLKLQELDLYYRLDIVTYKKKEQERALREERREEEKAQRELEQEKIRAEKEEMHYQAALERVRFEIESATGVKYEQLKEKIKYYEEELAEARANKERAISMAQQTRRGYVYVISNIGSFGENIYKIGMTRRLDPEDRIRELSNASVPFRFDIHAMIYSEDAPTLESMLHNTFDEQKVNLVNGKKEFFRVTLEEIQNKVKQSGIDAQFIQIAEARDYRESERIRNKGVSKEKAGSEFPDNLFDGNLDEDI